MYRHMRGYNREYIDRECMCAYLYYIYIYIYGGFSFISVLGDCLREPRHGNNFPPSLSTSLSPPSPGPSHGPSHGPSRQPPAPTRAAKGCWHDGLSTEPPPEPRALSTLPTYLPWKVAVESGGGKWERKLKVESGTFHQVESEGGK